MAKGPRAKKKSRLSNLHLARLKNAYTKASETSKSHANERKRNRNEKSGEKSVKRKKITVNKDVRKLPFREAVKSDSYCEIEKPRGRAGGYNKQLRSVRNLQGEKEKNRARNAKGHEQSRQRTVQKSLATKQVLQQALQTLEKVNRLSDLFEFLLIGDLI